MIINVVEHKEFIRALRGIYKDSWRFTLRVFKWMMRHAVNYVDARDLLRRFDEGCPLETFGKNIISRQIVETKDLVECEFLVDRIISPNSLDFKEDLGLMMYKTLVKRGYGFFKDTLFFLEDSQLTCSRPNDRYHVDQMLSVFFRPKKPSDPRDVLAMMRTLDKDFNVDLIDDYMKIGPIDKSLPIRAAQLINDCKGYMFRLNEGRIYEKVFFYQEDFFCVPVKEMPMDRISEVIRSFSGFSDKYEKLCKIFGIASFPTGKLLGSGSFGLLGSNNFYWELCVRGNKVERALIEYVVVCDKDEVEFDPFGHFCANQFQSVGYLELRIPLVVSVSICALNRNKMANMITVYDGANNKFSLEISEGECISNWTILNFRLCADECEHGKVDIKVKFSSKNPVQLNVRFETREWRGGKFSPGSVIS